MTVATLFPLGRLCATPAALDALTNANSHPLELLWRHARGDWGDLCPEDIEADRSLTTILLKENC